MAARSSALTIHATEQEQEKQEVSKRTNIHQSKSENLNDEHENETNTQLQIAPPEAPLVRNPDNVLEGQETYPDNLTNKVNEISNVAVILSNMYTDKSPNFTLASNISLAEQELVTSTPRTSQQFLKNLNQVDEFANLHEIVTSTSGTTQQFSSNEKQEAEFIPSNIVQFGAERNLDGLSPSIYLTSVSTSLFATRERQTQEMNVLTSDLKAPESEMFLTALEEPEKESVVHYLTPMSPRSVYEGDNLIRDYMRFIIQPFEKGSLVELSSETSTYVSCIQTELQRTIAIVKPDAVVYKHVIMRTIEENGFQIIGMRFVHLTPEQVSEIYARHYGSPSFPHLVISTSSGPVLVLSLAAVDAINKWKKIVGLDSSLKEEWFYPLSVRTRFGIKKTMTDALHASENEKESNRENRYFYPNSILEPLVTDLPKVTDYCSVYVLPTLTKGLVDVVKKKPIDPIMFLADWLLINNPFQPRLPYNIALTPT